MGPTTYAALLRGINVGGIRITMPDLRRCFEDAGCREVRTYLQTGNVVFTHDGTRPEVKALLEAALTSTFHYEAFVLLYEQSTLRGVIDGYPFARGDEHHAYVVFVDDAAAWRELAELSAGLDEPLRAEPGLLYWKVLKGQTLGTPFSKLAAKPRYKRCTTTRNLNTLERMADPGPAPP
jgi:uncharacterized protein (DUF1697 family)